MAEPEIQPVDSPTSTDWRDGISESNRSGVARFETVDSLAKGYTDLLTSQSTSVKMPTDKSTPEEVSSFYTRLGRPETSDGYTRPQLPEGKSYDEDLIGGMQTAFFEGNGTDKLWVSLVERYLAIEGKKEEAKEAEESRAQEEHDKVLQELWHIHYDANMEIARRGLRDLVPGELGEKFRTLIKDKGLEYDNVLLQAMCEMGKKILPDTFVASDGTPKVEKGYVPSHPNSPDMYRNADGDEGDKARAYFTAKGHIY